METVSDILRVKGNKVWTVGPDASVFKALELMARESIGSVMVVEDDFPIGIFTERHYAREVALKGRRSDQVAIKEVMSDKVVCSRPQQTLEECMAIMTGKRIRHLPVMDHARMIGIVSLGDVVRAVISERGFLIEQLETYITRG